MSSPGGPALRFFSALILCLTLTFVCTTTMVGSANASTDPLDMWVWRKPLPTQNMLNAIIYANNIFVAVGDYGTILTSADGITWTNRTSGAEASFKCICYGGDMFLAVGRVHVGGGFEDTVLTSPDGVTWTKKATLFESRINAVAYGNGTFVAVTEYGTAGTSADGAEWTWRSPGTHFLAGVTYGNNMFVAAGVGIFTSPDGITWTRRVFELSYRLTNVAFCNNVFMIVGYEASYGVTDLIYSSPDGVAWNLQKVFEPDTYSHLLSSITYGNNTYVAVGNTGFVMTSRDGTAWGWQILGVYTTRNAVAYGNGTFVAVGYDSVSGGSGAGGATISTSPDGITWTERASGRSSVIQYGVAYGNGTFVSVGVNRDNTGAGTIFMSQDWVTWPTVKVLGVGAWLNAIAYGNGRFVAVGFEGSDGHNKEVSIILSSRDGIHWTRSGAISRAELTGVTFGNNTFVAVGFYSSGNFIGAGRVFSSPDGLTWTEGTPIPPIPSTSPAFLSGVTYGNNTFVAVGGGIYTSPDGMTWTQRSSANPRAVAYGNNTFVAVPVYGNTGLAETVYTSPDGVTWTGNLVQNVYSALNGITYGNDTFVVVGDSGFIYTSPDGVTWTRRISGTGSNLYGIVYAAGSFVAVGAGNILQSVSRPGTFPLTVATSGYGIGTVTSAPTGIDCGSTCLASYAEGTTVTLTAVASPGTTPKSWSGCTSSSASTCMVAMDGARWVNAVFSLDDPVNLSIGRSKPNGGNGTVTSAPVGIDCGPNCSYRFARNSTVTLSAVADPTSNSVFAGWSLSSCPGTDPCAVSLDKPKTVTAKFIGPQTLRVTNVSIGSGKGSITSNPASIACSKGVCKNLFAYNTSVTLTATANPDSDFLGWSLSSCPGTDPCTVIMDKAKNITAKFRKRAE